MTILGIIHHLTETTSFYWAQQDRFLLKTEKDYSLRNVVFLKRQDN
jgi:hypothetical protein